MTHTLARSVLALGLLLAGRAVSQAPGTPEFRPTVARFAFIADPARHQEFVQAYEERLVPLLEQAAGLSLQRLDRADRARGDSVVSILYTFKSPVELAAFRDSVEDRDEILPVALELSRQFSEPGDLRMGSLAVYETPAGAGRSTPAGAGRRIELGAGRGHFRTFDVTDGLAGPMVISMLQDRTGHLWFGTYNNGVSRFDGQQWTNFDTDDGLAHNQVNSIHQDGDGDLWFATNGGISRFDGATWTTYNAASGVPARNVTAIAEDGRGHLWFPAMGTGLLHFDGAEWEVLTEANDLPSPVVFGVLCERYEQLWIATIQGIYRRDGERWTRFTDTGGLDSGQAMGLFEDSRGGIWANSEHGGLSRFDGTAWEAVAPEYLDHLTEKGVYDVYESADGSIWLSTGGAGLLRHRDGEWTAFTTDDGLAHNIVFCVYEDREGHIWAGNTGGLSRYDERSLTVYTRNDGLPAPGVREVYGSNNGDLWFVHGDWSLGRGLSRYDGESLTCFSTDDGLPHNDIYTLYEDRQGALWIGHQKGVTRYDGHTFHTYTEADGLRYDQVRAILQTSDGAYWFGTPGGVTRFDGQTMSSYSRVDGLPASYVSCLYEDERGDLWAATGMGLARFTGDGFEGLTVADGLGNPEVFGLAQDGDGALWLATHGGISRYDGQSFTNYTTDNGLTSNDVHGVFFDRDGVLWIGTDGGGVGRFDGQVFQSLTRADGLPTNVAMSIAQDRDGALWFSSNVGLSSHRPQKTETYPVSIEAVVADRRYEAEGEVRVPSTVDVVAFEFSGISFKTRPHQLVYRYRLRGYDDAWRQTRDNRVEYDGLPRGDYVFEVQSVDRDLNYSAGSASVPVRITFPYERLAWFVALNVAVLLVVLQAVRVVRRDRRLQDSNLELTDKTAALERAHQEVLQASQAKSAFLANVSHELRTPMNAIINFSALILENVYGDISEDMRDAVAEIDKNGGDLLALINDVLDLSKIEAGALELQLDECAPEVCIDTAVASIRHQAEAKGLTVVREVEGDLPTLWADERRLTQHVLLNLVRNAVKFTPRGEVGVGATTEDGDVRFWVRDTGQGIPSGERERVFEPFYQVDGSSTREAEGTGLGLAIVRRFVEMHGGRIWLSSEPGQGSTFQFTIPSMQPA